MRIDILTLFPGMFDGPMTESMLWKARELGLLDLRLRDMREFSHNKHHSVDDMPYGGGGGMVLRPDVVVRAIEAALDGAPEGTPVIFMSPQGRTFTHQVAVELSALPAMVLLCGHYEGIDERALQLAVTDEISLGDYVLTGGELAAMVIVDAVIRHLPGVLGAEGAADRDSHADGLLEGPQYTRPPEFRGLSAPDVLLEGDHKQAARWRRRQSLQRTWERRPDLLLKASLSEEDQYVLGELADAEARRRAPVQIHKS